MVKTRKSDIVEYFKLSASSRWYQRFFNVINLNDFLEWNEVYNIID